jgi:spermidine/putrescine-binding protein
MWGTLGILYNTTMVHEPVDSWDVFWDERYRNNIFMYDSMRDTLAVAFKRLGFSLNSRNIVELNMARDILIEQKPLVRAYLDDAVKHSMIGREGALAVVYSGDAFFCIEENPELAYVVPREGSNVFYDAMVIPRGAKNKEEAELFINFLSRPDIALMNTLYIGYSTVNAGAFAMLPDDWKNCPVYWTPDEVYAKCETFLDLGGFIAEYDRAWTEVMAAR